MKIVVTGGGGFIGSHLIDNLISDNEVIAIDTNKDVPRNLLHLQNNRKFSYVERDILKKESLDQIITDNVDVIYHLAAVVGVGDYCKDPLKVIDVNTIGTRNILEIARQKNIKVVFSSTSEVYGKNPEVPWTEESDRVLGDPTIDRWCYSTTKGLCEHMIHAMHRMYGLPVVVLRYFNAYGPRQRPDFAISNMIHRVLNDKNPIIHDTGEQTRCFTFIKDIVQGTIMAANNPKANGEVFNIGNTKETNITDLAQYILELSEKSSLHREYVDTKKVFSGKYEDLKRRIPDTSKAKRILNWQASTSLTDGLNSTIKWALENRWWLKG